MAQQLFARTSSEGVAPPHSSGATSAIVAENVQWRPPGSTAVY